MVYFVSADDFDDVEVILEQIIYRFELREYR